MSRKQRKPKTLPGEMPPMRRLADAELGYLRSQFNLYDTSKKGMISQHLAQKILQNIGVEPSVLTLPKEVGFVELAVFIDSKLPDPEPALDCSLHTFSRMVGTLEPDGVTRVIRPQAIIDFLTSLDRPAPTYAEANLLLTSMQDYDNVDSDIKVNAQKFCNELSSYSKKANALKEFR